MLGRGMLRPVIKAVASWTRLAAPFFLFVTTPSFGGEVAATCFDFNKKVVKSLFPNLPLKSNEVTFDQGKRSIDEVEYAGARSLVNKSIMDTYKWLLDHTNWKDMTRTKLKVREIEKPGYMAFHRVEVDIHIFAFISLDWIEEWAYALVRGTKTHPQEIQISYQKVSGTGHVAHLCGSITLRKVGNKTDILLYEEAYADRYHSEHMLNMHQNTIRALNGKPRVADKIEEK